MRLAPFAHLSAAQHPLQQDPDARPLTASPATKSSAPADKADRLALGKREWLLDAMERHWELSETGSKIERRFNLTREEFLERYYAPGRPVILVGEMAEWPALSRWTPQYLRGDRLEGGRYSGRAVQKRPLRDVQGSGHNLTYQRTDIANRLRPMLARWEQEIDAEARIPISGCRLRRVAWRRRGGPWRSTAASNQ